MKTLHISVLSMGTDNVQEAEYSFNYEELKDRLHYYWDCLTKTEREDCTVAEVTEHEVRVPDDCYYPDAESYVNAIRDGDIESPDYDSLFGFTDDAILRQYFLCYCGEYDPQEYDYRKGETEVC